MKGLIILILFLLKLVVIFFPVPRAGGRWQKPPQTLQGVVNEAAAGGGGGAGAAAPSPGRNLRHSVLLQPPLVLGSSWLSLSRKRGSSDS